MSKSLPVRRHTPSNTAPTPPHPNDAQLEPIFYPSTLPQSGPDADQLVKGIRVAIELIEQRLGADTGADYAAMTEEHRFLNQIRYSLLESVPMTYALY